MFSSQWMDAPSTIHTECVAEYELTLMQTDDKMIKQINLTKLPSIQDSTSTPFMPWNHNREHLSFVVNSSRYTMWCFPP